MSRCPVCDALLTVIGSRVRTRRTPEGIRHRLIIRRLRCLPCRRIHHELPDCLVPFKRYDAEALESFATQGPTAAVAADTSTLVRWQAWLAVWMPYVQRCWAALAARDSAAEMDGAPPFPAALHGRAPWTQAPPGWLRVIVHRLVNAALWPQTRSALVT
jgi:hypothetical protein